MGSVVVAISTAINTAAGLTVVVTGGAGFLGSHLCQRLVDQGHRVVCVDNLHTGRQANVSALAASGRFEFIEHDITVPFGGFKQSGIGRDKSLHALEKYTELKTTWIDLS